MGSRGSGVHATIKYRFKRLFLENNRFIWDLSLQFSGFLRASNFDKYSKEVFGRNGLQMPLVAHQCDHIGELG
jgi:hypothetical protein